MKHLIFATICILAGIALIRISLLRRRYITLSGHADGKLWVKRVTA